ncbi:DUF262 domain-containing protein [Micromonospora sp. NPDC005172]|uniref:DUF262 domain-containing protein n=1 Tax=Micromonospora sp. NPDC005172 TaxID=3156867 RepID=UPI0033A3D8AA
MARRKANQTMLLDPDQLITSVDSKVNAVRTQSIDFSFNELADMYNDQELIIDPEFQRMFRWPEGSQARFIESLLLELPVPPIFLIEREDRVYELIDGLQRISSYLNFRGQLKIDGKLQPPLVLADCDIVKELNGLTYQDLPRAMEIKLKRSYIRAEILRKESDPRLRYYMFKRLNTGGETLEAQEVRNATIRLLSNDFNSFISQLSKGIDFAYCIDIISYNQKKQKFDQELVLRFFSYKNDGARYRHDVANFLTDYMEAVSDPVDPTEFDYNQERAVFEKTFRILRVVSDHLGIDSKIFGTVDQRYPEPRSQFSVYHYEGIVLGLQQVLDKTDPEDAAQVERLGQAVMRGKFDRKFLDHCGGGKNSRNELNARVKYFSDAFRAAIS